LVALARKDIEVFTAPNRNEAQLTMPWTTILGTVTVLTVVDQPSTGWVEVMLPIRPNGSTGFVQTTDVEIYAVGGKILVDLSERELTYTLDGTEVISTTVAVGTPSNPTPTGTFFVTDNVTLANPNSPWGPHALGLSARSETITEYNGGDGIIGIHGTSNPSSIGQAASLGCVRLPNDLITLLHELVPIGTPVEIRA
jgi:lipoprotein-anchoring transpeptidase ErfK/SrfK